MFRTTRTISLGASLAASVWLTASATAGTAGEQPMEAPEVLVAPRRVPGLSVDADRYPGHATVLTRSAIAASGAANIQELLARQAGVFLIDQQGFGLASDGSVNLRGVVNTSRTDALVLLDGVRQNRLTGDEVHWQSFPLDHIERIEILRGGSATIYGEGALAGVINIITRQDGDKPVETEHAVEAGSFGWQRYHTGARGRAGRWTYAVQGTRTLLEGYRESSESRGTVVNAHAGLELADGLTSRLHVLHAEDVTAFPGLLTLVQSQQKRTGTNAFHGFNTNEEDQASLDVIAGPVEGLSAVVTGFWRRRTQFSKDTINFNSFTVTPSHGASVRGNYETESAAVRSLFVAGAEGSWDKATAGDPGLGEDGESTRRGYGLFTEETLTLNDRLTLSTGIRMDRSRYEESLAFPAFEGTLRFKGWSPKAAVSYVLVPGAMTAFASYARPFKAPNVDDFSVRTVDFVGNPRLQPQQADTYELGVRGSRGAWDAGLTGFYTRTDDEILVNFTAFESQNFDTRRTGLELSAGAQLPRVRSRIAYTFIDAEFRKGAFAGHTIPGTPKHTLSAGLEASPWPGLWVGGHWRLVNDFYRLNDMTNRLGRADNYGVLDLVARYEFPEPNPWGPGEAYVRVLNATNEEYGTFQSSNATNLIGAGEAPMPPIGMLAGVRWEW